MSAGPIKPPDDLVRSANAVANGNLDDAELLLAQAENMPRSGLVLLTRCHPLSSRRFPSGQVVFRRTLGDVEFPDRRSKSLCNLGNCLVRQAGEMDIKQLQSAIDCFEPAIRERPTMASVPCRP